jgi:hypothetical protein
VVEVTSDKGIPKSAVKSLTEYCIEKSKKTGASAAEILKNYLKLMKKYAEYFFGEPWPEKPHKEFGFDLGEAERKFIGRGKTYAEKVERFTVVCLRRNISMEGFDAQGFEEDFEFYGGRECWDCVVPDAVRLREDIERIERTIKNNEEEMKQEEPSWIAKEMYEHYRRPDVVRRNKMMVVELRLFEEIGRAEGKSCEVKNKYRCPYGKRSEQLIKHGRLAKAVWREIEWYDAHWNPSSTHRPSVQDMKWYHYGEPSIIDVTSYEDIMRAIENGRFEKILEEHRKYLEETEREARAL